MNKVFNDKEDRSLTAKVVRVWRSNGIAWSTIQIYRYWVRRFREDCRQRGQTPEAQLRREVVQRWVVRYVRTRKIALFDATHSARSALWAWSWGLQACGHAVPPWDVRPTPTPSLPPLLALFVKHRVEVQGLVESSVRRDLSLVQEFLHFLRRRRHTIATIQVTDIDRFLTGFSGRFVLRTLARVACVLRAFLRFLYTSGQIAHELASLVATPRVRRGELPPRALPWPDVRRIIGAIDKRTRTGRRDYALLLTMTAYGLGSGEVRGLTLESVDWRRRQIRVVRPKTRREISLPLLPGVAQALVAYLRHGRPRHCTSRALFVMTHAPYVGLGSATAIRHVLRKHAQAAGVSAAYLGSHVLRHSHASRQIDQGVSVAVVADILGHRRPESTSAYVRVALRRLRGVALPVPR